MTARTRGVRFVVALAGTVAMAAGASRLPEALARVPVFDVAGYELEGTRYLTLTEAIQAAAVPSGASVWDDPEAWEEGLRSHPLVVDAEVHRRLPGTLVFRVEEREPVALLPTPTLVPVDAEGRALPLDPTLQPLDLPVVRPTREAARGAARLTPEELRALAGELDRLGDLDPEFPGLVSEIGYGPDGDAVVARTASDPSISLVFEAPLTATRLREGMDVWRDVLSRYPDRTPRRVDLRFADQVVVRLDRP